MKIVSWRLSHSTIRKTIGQVHLFTEEIAFFQKISVFNNLLGPEELIL